MGFVSSVTHYGEEISRIAGQVETGARAVQGAVSGASGGAGAALASYRAPNVTTIPTPGLSPDQSTILIAGGLILVVVLIMAMR